MVVLSKLETVVELATQRRYIVDTIFVDLKRVCELSHLVGFGWANMAGWMRVSWYARSSARHDIMTPSM